MKTFTYKEVSDSAIRTGHNPTPKDARFGNLFTPSSKFELRQVSLEAIHYCRSWRPSESMRSGETNVYHDDNGNPIDSDEYYARKYARLYPSGTTAEPIILTASMDIADGRHRSRAAYLRGESAIMAYVEILDLK